jgi:Haem-binding domain
MKRKWRWLFAGMAAVLVLMQFTNPALTNPPVEPGHDLFATNPPPQEIASVLRAACYDCHSHDSQWPWYARVAPVSWWIAGHVSEARQHLDFSEWPHDRPKRARSNWEDVADEVRSGRMPLPSYTWMHAAARLTADQRERLATWAEQEAKRLEAGEAGR